MKELSIEEKAKRYDEAIERAKALYAKDAPDSLHLETIFPELKESKDERIRKEIISHVQYLVDYYNDSMPNYGKWLAWLEKQGKNTYNKELSELLHKVICRFINDPNIPYTEREKVSMEIIPYVERLEKQGEHANFCNKIQIGDKVTRNRDGVLVNLSQLNRVAKKDEKQGENFPILSNSSNIGKDKQKPTDKVEPKFKIGDTIIAKQETCMEHKPFHITDISDGFYWSGEDSILIDNQNEFELYEVEPKFKIGDLITNSIIIGKVDENDNNKYHGWFGYDKDLSVHYADIPDVENWHLWTIQDAKDGDVLVVNNEVFIYAHRKQMYSIAVAHCFVDSAGGFYFDGEFGYTENGNSIHPATKEQRDLLFQKMKEAGYEWDAEKKELKKIEQKPAWSEEDESLRRRCIGAIDMANLSDYTKDNLLNWLKSLKDRLQPQPKSAWSEEDEKYTQGLIRGLKANRDIFKFTIFISDSDSLNITSTIDWLESLKNRVQPQEKQEWSEEDATHYNRILKELNLQKEMPINASVIEEVKSDIIWFKSLRPQNRWKPSDEQMENLSRAFNGGTYRASLLMELYQDLKKLK